MARIYYIGGEEGGRISHYRVFGGIEVSQGEVQSTSTSIIGLGM